MKVVRSGFKRIFLIMIFFVGCAPKPVGVQMPTTVPTTKPAEVFFPGCIPDGCNIPCEWIPSCPENSWKVIVVHHSASVKGGAKIFHEWHLGRGWDELGYHFVIGNGTDTPDGYVEVGSRWLKQKRGSHTKSADGFFNEHGIGICVVGDFENSGQGPSPAQMESLHRLMTFLMTRYCMKVDNLYCHREVPGNDTVCPGKNFPMAELREWVKCSPEIQAAGK